MKEDDEVSIKSVKKVYQYVSKNRYRLAPSGYRFDRWMFNFFMFAIFGWLLYVCVAHNWQMDYFECQDPNDYVKSMGCENPFYKPVTWKNQEHLPVGVYGNKPGALFQSAMYVPIILLAISFLLNHLIHNKKGDRQ